MRFFNTTGPVDPHEHYALPPLARLDQEELSRLIAQKRYFILHAPRQTGKTSALLALMEQLNSEARYRCCYVNVEGAQAAREDVFRGIRAILSRLAETGQVFEEAALVDFWHLTHGQPWLVNALANEVCFETQTNRDRFCPITGALVSDAKEALIERRDTHLDQLIDKLQEERVQRVIEPILNGDTLTDRFREPDLQYVRDLGLIHLERGQPLRIANAIYQEIIPREITFATQYAITHETAWYLREDGSLDMPKLLAAFQDFFRQHAEHWIKRFQYKEAGPQLLLQAFLQRLVNGGGRIEREYGLGRMRTDLLVIWPKISPEQRIVIELKLLHDSRESTIREGLAQTVEYLQRAGSREGHLVIFDRRADRPWTEKIFQEAREHQGFCIRIWGM